MSAATATASSAESAGSGLMTGISYASSSVFDEVSDSTPRPSASTAPISSFARPRSSAKLTGIVRGVSYKVSRLRA